MTELDETVPSDEPPPPRPSPAPPSVSSGSRVGPYSVERELARGGQGAVLSARHVQLGTRAAVKVLLDTSAPAVARFEREAKLLARLHHRNLPTVSDLGYADGRPYLAMELIEGRDLKALVHEGGAPEWSWTADVLGAVADVLHYCHGHGVVHRDVKPANILLERVTGRPVLVDFGLAKPDADQLGPSLEERASALSKTGEVKGTPAFMAPEQASPEFGEISPATDVYALGATLYYLLTGSAPFSGNSIFSLLHKVMEAPPPDPVAANPEVPFPLADLCKRAMAKSPEERPPSAAAFAAELREATRASSGAPSTVGLVRRLYGRQVWIASLVLASGISAGAGWIVGTPTEAETRNLERAAALTAKQDTWDLAQRLLGGGTLNETELKDLGGQSKGAPWQEWVPHVRVRAKLAGGAPITTTTLLPVPEGPDRDLIELNARLAALEATPSPPKRLLRLARSAEESRLPWAGDAVSRWDRLATELAYRGRTGPAAEALTRAATLAATRGVDAVLQRLEHAAELDLGVTVAYGAQHAALLLDHARAVIERGDLRIADAPALARARSQLVLYRMLRPRSALPPTTVKALERLADARVLPFRNAVLPNGSWQLRLTYRDLHVRSLNKGKLHEGLRVHSWRQDAHVSVHLRRYWLLLLPEASRTLWHDLAKSEMILLRQHVAQRAAEEAVARTETASSHRGFEERLLAQILVKRGRHRAAIRILTPQIKRLPPHKTTYSRLRRAASYLSLERYADAKTDIEHLSDPRLGWLGRRTFWWHRGDALQGEGTPAPAARCWQEAERLKREPLD